MPMKGADMKLTNAQIKKRLAIKEPPVHTQKGFYQTIFKAKEAFYESEADEFLSDMEFLYQQSKFIQKRWWILQGMVLSFLWMMLALTESSAYIQRYFGVSAPLFAVLILPELWKNKSSHAVEIEYTSCYTLRQIYAAKILLSAITDFLLLLLFSIASIQTGKILFHEIIIQFILPYSVTSCICFRTLYSWRISSELVTLFLCTAWCIIWMYLVADEKIYERIAQPTWLFLTFLSICYLGYCILRGQNHCKEQALKI